MSHRVSPLPPPPAPADAAWFFDIDGTLLDIQPTPENVHVDASLAALLDVLSQRAGGALALVSGRAIRDLDRIFAGRRWPAAGQHGAEQRDAAGGLTTSTDPASLESARRVIQQAIAAQPAVILEDKGASLALHYRRAPALGSFAHRVMRRAAELVGDTHDLRAGKRVVELVPVGSNKGNAIRSFMQVSPFRGRVPVFVGDDVTDEDGFALVNAMGGWSIKVGSGRTAARWRLPDVRAVRQWLARGGSSTSGR